jgi:DNA-binding transcriptional LysR family regulator
MAPPVIPLDSDLMRTFLAVADTGSVTGAADRVGRTQSAVSMQIRRLEDSLGQPLFHRLPRGVTLTARGAQLVPYARGVTGLLAEAAVALREKPLVGPVRIGAPDEYAGSVLPRALAAFALRHPAVEVAVRCESSPAQIAALAEDRLDLAVLFDLDHVAADEVLCIDPTVWVTSLAHAQHRQTPVPVATFASFPVCRANALRSLSQQSIPCRVAFESDTSAMLRVAAQSGLAIAPLSRSTIPPDCRELTAADGFPIIDRARIVLRRNPRGTAPAVEGLAAALRQAFLPLTDAAA